MEIKFSSIAEKIGITQITLSCFISGSMREEPTARRVGSYTGLPWQRLQEMMPVDVEAVLLQVYLDKHFPWLHTIRLHPRDNENDSAVSA
jgi:hypothetical protein